MRFTNNDNSNGGSQGYVRAPDATDHDTDVSATSTAPRPQPSVDMENYMNYMLLNPPRRINRKATMLEESYSLLLVYFVAEVQLPLTGPAYVLQRVQRFRVFSCGRTRFLSRFRVDGRFF